MSQYKIYDTTLKCERPDNDYKAFIKVCNEVFPTKLESTYVTLTNLLIDYLIACNSLENKVNSVDKNISNIQSEARKLKQADDEETVLFNALMQAVESLKENQNKESYQLVSSLAARGRDLFSKKEAIESRMGDYHEQHMLEELAIGDDRGSIQSLINSISAILHIIDSNKKDGRPRLDNLQVLPKHLEIIDALTISDIEKETLKTLLVAYTNMRITCFQKMEDFASKVVAEYQQRRLLEGISEEELNDFNLGISTLYAFELGDHHEDKFISPLICPTLLDEAKAMDVLTNYLQNKTFNTDRFNEIKFSNRVSSATMDAINEMAKQSLNVVFTSSGR